MLKELFNKNYTESNKETYVYLSNVNKVLDEVRENIKALQVEAFNNEDYEGAEAYKTALYEMAFIGNRILDKQLMSLSENK